MGSKNDISLKALAKINLGLDVVRRSLLWLALMSSC